MVIFKFNSAGLLQWTKTIGGAGYDYALSVIQTNDGGYALFGSTDSFGAGYLDFYIAKLDSTGSLQWTKTIGGTGGDYGASIVQLPMAAMHWLVLHYLSERGCMIYTL